jgi:hypothetical protein
MQPSRCLPPFISRVCLPMVALAGVLDGQVPSRPASRPASAPAGTRPGETRATQAKAAFRETVLQATASWVDHRLGRDTAVEVDGTTLPLREIEERVSAEGGLKTPSDVALAMAHEVILTALTNALRRAGKWPDEATVERLFEEHKAKYDGTPFRTEILATQFKGYPTLPAYQRRYAVMSAYELAIEKEITDAALARHLEEVHPFFADQKVKVSLLCFTPSGAGDWSDAERKAQQARTALTAGASFDELAKAAGPRSVSAAHPLNLLRKAVGESEYSLLLLRPSVSDALFYRAKVGEVVGPLRGTDACWVGRVEERTLLDRKLSIEDAQIREMVRQTYVQERLLAWSDEVLARAILRVHVR